ncbi:MAG: GH3 auxin-responsive promoter family protein [Bacteroidota bacterium]
MSLKTIVGKAWSKIRARQVWNISRHALRHQDRTFRSLIQTARHTAFGKAHDFQSIQSVEDFQARVPVRDYEGVASWMQRIYEGEADVSWPGKPLYLAKTSGTTSGAKYIPITKASIKKQILGARDTLMIYIAETGKADFLEGKMMFLSGSPEIDSNPHGIQTGRLSGIVNHFVPSYLLANRVPSYEANIIEDWEAKVHAIVQEVVQQDLRLISGIPPWVQMFFEELEAQTGKGPLEVWPNLQLFVQGGVDFQPYRPIFEKYFGNRVDMAELFPASEGFFAFQNEQEDDGMLLMPNYGIFYEFIPLESYGNPDAPRLTLKDVAVGEQYALIISTNAGLWAYDIGDTVKFTSVAPWKVRVSGRVKHFISAFGEHVISEEVNRAILEATQATGASFQEFTVAPLIVEEKGMSAHEWLIEFTQPPASMDEFVEVLDQSVRKQNAYYNDLREGNILRKSIVRSLQLNASREYMKSIGKLGGQNKFPRLSNNRKIAEHLGRFVLAEH